MILVTRAMSFLQPKIISFVFQVLPFLSIDVSLETEIVLICNSTPRHKPKTEWSEPIGRSPARNWLVVACRDLKCASTQVVAHSIARNTLQSICLGDIVTLSAEHNHQFRLVVEVFVDVVGEFRVP